MRSYYNNFDFIRLFASLVVVINHCYPLLNGKPHYDWLQNLTGTYGTGSVCLYTFFTISGYLISKSWQQKTNLLFFIQARALRIFPAIIFLVIILTLLVGPALSTYTLSEYFADKHTWLFFKNCTAICLQFNLPGVFNESFLHTNSIVGSLWSLSYEWVMYFTIAALGIFNIFNRRKIYLIIQIPILILFIYLDACKVLPALPFTSLDLNRIVSLYVYFFMGNILYLYKNQIPLNKVICLILIIIGLFFCNTKLMAAYSYIMIPYLIVYFANLKLPSLAIFTQLGDFSYGIYIYSFFIQQFILYCFKGAISLPLFMILSLASSYLAGMFSWFVIEKRAISWKEKLR